MKVYVTTTSGDVPFHFNGKSYRASDTRDWYSGNEEPRVCFELTQSNFARLVLELQSQFGEVVFGRRSGQKAYLEIHGGCRTLFR